MPIDLSQLKFVLQSEEDPNDDYEELDEDNEFTFTKEYNVAVADPSPPNVTKAARGPGYLPAPQPLVEILVRTIDRNHIPSGEFYAYMDSLCEDFLQFSVAVFTKNGLIKESLKSPSPDRGTGVWGTEIDHGKLAYIETIRVNPRYHRQGVGRWAIESLLQSKELADCPYIFTWATALNTASFFGPPDSDVQSKERVAVAFFRALGFRRVGGTWFFGYARDAQHPMRSLRVEDDAEVTQVTAASIMDALPS